MIKKSKKILVLSVFLLVMGLCGCNIFEFLHMPTGSVDEHIARGQKYLDERDYASAVYAFRSAIDCDSGNSDARYGYAKAYARLYLKKDIFDLALDFSDPQTAEYLFDFSDEEIDSIYNVSSEVRNILRDVYYGRCHGEIQPRHIYIDYGMSCALEAITYPMVKFRQIMWQFNQDGFFELTNLEHLSDDEINDILDTIEELLPLAVEAIAAAMGEETQEVQDAVDDILEHIDQYRP
ncbi:hypothetical protein KAI68_05265 [bacterium]|nr:hypothetical protein [bacterium]